MKEKKRRERRRAKTGLRSEEGSDCPGVTRDDHQCEKGVCAEDDLAAYCDRRLVSPSKHARKDPVKRVVVATPPVADVIIDICLRTTELQTTSGVCLRSASECRRWRLPVSRAWSTKKKNLTRIPLNLTRRCNTASTIIEK